MAGNLMAARELLEVATSPEPSAYSNKALTL